VEVDCVITVTTPQGDSTPYRERILPDGRPIPFKVCRKDHELRCIPGGGVACDESVLTLESLGYPGLGVRRQATGQDLWAPWERWRDGRRIDYGYGSQLALAWDEMLPLPGSVEQVALF
jgi:hypothetical protein